MKTIQEILMSVDSDKHNETEHSYGAFYDQLLELYGRDAELNILELGVQRGGSLKAWAEYFPNANIFGVDIEDQRLDKYKDLDRVNFYVGDLRDAINLFTDMKFDIIIDDSDHKLKTAIWIVQNYSSLLDDNGVLVIEDVQDPPLWYRYLSIAMPNNFELEAHDMRHLKGRYDDYIITVNK